MKRIGQYSASRRSTVLVVLQFVLMFAIAWYAGVWGGVVANILTILAIALGVWAIVIMRLRVNIFPDVHTGQQLYTGGPYRLIRHPMYTAVLLATFAWMLNRVDLISSLLWLTLLADLLLKLRHEEALLAKSFTEYPAYMRRTKRLVPFVL